MIKASDFYTLDRLIFTRTIKAFGTKKECQSYAKSIGWLQYHVVKVQRNLEAVWIVAQSFHQDKIVAGVNFENLVIPTGNYEFKNGTSQMITVEVKKKAS